MALSESQDDGSLSQVLATPVVNDVSTGISVVCCKLNEVGLMY